MKRMPLTIFWTVLLLLASADRACAFAYLLFDDNKLDTIVHQFGYYGVRPNVHLDITVGIDPTSAHAGEMVVPTLNVIDVWNGLEPTTGNLVSGSANNVPRRKIDFESVLLHEMGHALGLAHPNLGNTSGVNGDDQDYTKTAKGANGRFDLNPGPDGVIGSADDRRGDDQNLNWFRKSNNNPFSIAATVDKTTYSRNLADLPAGDAFSTNPDRTVASTLFGLADTESVMQQLTFFDEAQRTLGPDDVASIRMAMAGKDERAGTRDDYTFTLRYEGMTDTADIVIDFDDSKTDFANTLVHGNQLVTTPTHYRLTDADVFFNDNGDWFFNDVRAGDIDGDGRIDDDDLSLLLSGFGDTYDTDDLSTLLDNFGRTDPAIGSMLQAVPEPSGLALAAIGLVSLLACARWRRASFRRRIEGKRARAAFPFTC